jgi:hypothetical protein
MDFFRDMGREVEALWRESRFDPEAFPGVAVEVLSALRPSSYLHSDDVSRWVLAGRDLPPQMRSRKFGQPPVVVFHSDAFVIQVLYWLEGTTSIHEHSFHGAFHVMEGSSVHCLFDFEEEARWGDHLKAGRLSLRKAEVLERGDVRPIHRGAGTIHSLYHLDRPSVSVVVRTRTGAQPGAQFNYHRPGVAWDPFHHTDPLQAAEEVLTAVFRAQAPDRERRAAEALRNADPFSTFRILHGLSRLIHPASEYDALLERVGPLHGDLVERVRAAVREGRRDDAIVRVRNATEHREQRLFLALLLNIREPGPIVRVLRGLYSDRNPEALIERWARELRAWPVVDELLGAKGVVKSAGAGQRRDARWWS